MEHSRRHVYIIVKESGSRQTVFVRFDKDGRIVVSDRSFKEAKVFGNELSAKEIAFKLNDRRYGDGGWFVRDYYL